MSWLNAVAAVVFGYLVGVALEGEAQLCRAEFLLGRDVYVCRTGARIDVMVVLPPVARDVR